jgi:hypothetical protein
MGINIESELGGDHHLVAYRRKRFAQQLFVGEWPICLCCIKECNAAFDGFADQ